MKVKLSLLLVKPSGIWRSLNSASLGGALVLLWLALLLSGRAVADSKCIRIASYVEEPLSQAFVEPIAKVYEIAGLCTALQVLPAGRAHSLMLQGHIDAQVGRTEVWVNQFRDDIALVPVPLLKFDAMLVMKKRTLIGADRGRLSFSNAGVVFSSGSFWASNWIVKHDGRPVAVPNLLRVEALLGGGRAAGALYLAIDEEPLPWLGINTFDFKKVDELVIYHVLAKNQARLIPTLATALKQLGGADFFEQYLPNSVFSGGR